MNGKIQMALLAVGNVLRFRDEIMADLRDPVKKKEVYGGLWEIAKRKDPREMRELAALIVFCKSANDKVMLQIVNDDPDLWKKLAGIPELDL